MDGPKKNPELAHRMMDTFEKTGLVLLRGNREVGDHLDVMRDWANLCFPNVSKYEGGANQRHGTHVANVYEVSDNSEISRKYKNKILLPLAVLCRLDKHCCMSASQSPNYNNISSLLKQILKIRTKIGKFSISQM